MTKNLDELDLHLVQEFEANAQQDYVSLAKKMGVTSMTVGRRLKRLIHRRVIAFATVVDPRAVGFSWAALEVNTLPDKVEDVANQLASSKNIQHVMITTGRYDVFAFLIVRNNAELLDVVTQQVGKISGITNIETFLGLRTIKSRWAYPETDQYILQRTSERLDPGLFDLSLVRELELDSRQTITELANKLGMSRSSVSRKLRAMYDHKFLRTVAIPDLTAFGYKIPGVILIKAHPDKIYDVANKTAQYWEVKDVMVGTGSYGVYVFAYFKGLRAMYDFLTNTLGPIPGITRYETMVPIGVQKMSLIPLPGYKAEMAEA